MVEILIPRHDTNISLLIVLILLIAGTRASGCGGCTGAQAQPLEGFKIPKGQKNKETCCHIILHFETLLLISFHPHLTPFPFSP